LVTVEYLSHRGNANQTASSAKESEQIVDEMVLQLLEDKFAHGDLQNRANILLLEGERPPAFIDLSLSEHVEEADLLLVVRLFDRLNELHGSINSRVGKLMAVLGTENTDNTQKLAESLWNATQKESDKPLKKVTVEKWKAFIEKMKEGHMIDALEALELSDLKKPLRETIDILRTMVDTQFAKTGSHLTESINPVLKEMFSKFSAGKPLGLTQFVIELEKNGLVFHDRFMFLLEYFALMANEQALHPEVGGKKAIVAVAEKIGANLTLAQKTKLLTRSTARLIQDCVTRYEKLISGGQGN
jgi:hypothetical protein